MIPLPHDPEAEASFLATCCAPGGSQEYETEIRRLTPEHFLVPRNRVIFEALRTVRSRRAAQAPQAAVGVPT